MSGLKATPNPKEWWNQFPPNLKLIAICRLWASIGAGGVLYLSPLLFSQLGFSASQVGNGITIAAISGTFSRLITGFFLNKQINCSIPLRIAAFFAVVADLILFRSYEYNSYILGQFLLGSAAGIYWPSAELAVPISSGNYPSSKGFALVRSADALGVSLGSILGTLASWIESIRIIYLLDIFCMLILVIFLANKNIRAKNNLLENEKLRHQKSNGIRKW